MTPVLIAISISTTMITEVKTRRPIYLLIGPSFGSFFIITRMAMKRLTIINSTKATRIIFINIAISSFIISYGWSC